MNNIEILEEFIPLLEDGYVDNKDCTKEIQAIENLIKEYKELNEKFDVMQRRIYRLEEDNIELLKPKGKDQLNYKYIECPKVEAEWHKSESYIEENYIPKLKVKENIEEINKILDRNLLVDNLRNYFTAKKEALQEILEGGE